MSSEPEALAPSVASLHGLPSPRALLLAPMHLLMVLMFFLRRVLIEILKLSNQKWGKAG